MPRGGARLGAGRPRRDSGVSAVPSENSNQNQLEAGSEGLSPLEYMLAVMRDPGVDDGRRDKMAIAAAPYVHGRAGEQALGKKEQQEERAKEAARGRFASRPPPTFTVQ